MSVPDLPARFGADLAVDLVDRRPAPLELLLDLGDLAVRELADLMPGRCEVAAAGNAVREMADEHGIEIGHVVGPDGLEVLRREEGGTESAGRRHEIGLGVEMRAGKRLAVGALYAELRPFLNRPAVRRSFLRAIDVAAEIDLDAPGQTLDPSLLLELLAGRAEGISRRAEQIELAVVVEINARAVEFRGHELREAHGAGPGAAHGIAWDDAVLQEPQRVDQLGLEEILPAADIGLRRKHADDVVARAMTAEGGLAAPDREHDGAIDTDLALDLVEDGLVAFGKLAALPREPLDLLAIDVLLGCAAELGLCRRARLGLFRQHEVRKREIGRDAVESAVEGRARDARALRLGPEAFEPRAEGRPRLGLGVAARQMHERKRHGDSDRRSQMPSWYPASAQMPFPLPTLDSTSAIIAERGQPNRAILGLSAGLSSCP